MDRSAATTYLAGTLAQLLTDAGLAATDSAGALKEVIDDALLMVGTAYDDLATATVASADVLGFRAVLRYAGLVRVRDAIANRVDITLDGPSMSKSRSQAVKALDKIIEGAELAAAPYVVSGQWGSGTIAMDYLEPVVSYGD